MKILVIEDSPEKARHLVEFLSSELAHPDVETRQSYRNGLAAIRDGRPELVLLDMTLPNYDRSGADRGGRTRVYAGRDILREMQRLKLPSHAIIVTQFETFREDGQERTLEELQRELEDDFPINYLGTVYYHASRSDWRPKLAQLIRTAESTQILSGNR
jgi:CheY-like chemotaxis protein